MAVGRSPSLSTSPPRRQNVHGALPNEYVGLRVVSVFVVAIVRRTGRRFTIPLGSLNLNTIEHVQVRYKICKVQQIYTCTAQ